MSQGRNRLDDVDVWVTIVALELDQCVVLTRQLAQYGSGQRCHQLVTSRLIGQDGFGDDKVRPSHLARHESCPIPRERHLRALPLKLPTPPA